MVNVPVLSKSTVVTCALRSRAVAERTRIPRALADPAPAMTAVGVARPIAQGHAITNTETAAKKAGG